eukprot:s1662_g1.t1
MVGGILFHAESCGEMKLYTGHICGDGATAFLISGLLSIVTMVFWSGVVRLAFSAETPFGKEAETDWLEIAGSNSRAAYRFLVYVLVVLISLRLKGIKAQHHSRTVSGWVRPFVLPPERVFLWPALFRASPSARFVAVILFSPRPSWSRLRFGRFLVGRSCSPQYQRWRGVRGYHHCDSVSGLAPGWRASGVPAAVTTPSGGVLPLRSMGFRTSFAI